ncbi:MULTISPECIES: hypothetical protein [Anoxynatronum]|uniref:Uncharacterized protein n=2 Tax=Anoxynatronum TaxID=210622 RepID=A0AA45WV51_9CLOT|nr:hypothetical protein [Anoxynatronum buryatiense]SMP51415.1 hypothetical protein SAMN06296020_10498 [Anoxynatronum buryatiense]
MKQMKWWNDVLMSRRGRGMLILMLGLVLMLTACGGSGGNEAQAPEPPAQAESVADVDGPGSELFGPPIEGERYETEKVSMVIPDGWNVMDISGGLQAYQGNNAVEVWVRGSGLSDGDAEKAMEGLAADYDGSPVETFEHWGLTFYSTVFEMYGSQQFKMSAVKDGERIEIGLAMHSSADEATEDLMFGMLDTIELK